ncbi:MAG: hypothetical protein JO243_24540, partial [Solirubrobacterales bacterium]|nr:hypothetical protein [Solirubrobacterales bacterium]
MMRLKLVLTALVSSVLLASPSSAPAQNGGSVTGLLFAFPAGGKLVSQTNIPIQVTGQLTIAFHGSVAAGCAGYGLCPYSGTIVVSPRSGQLGVEKIRIRGRTRELAFLALSP